MNKIFTLFLTIICLSGCKTFQNNDPVVQSTKQWEGHYMTVQEFKEKTTQITLDKNESIWVLSNNTLRRLLTNTQKDK